MSGLTSRADRDARSRSRPPLASSPAARRAAACCPSPAPTSSTTRSRSSCSRPSPTSSIRWRSPSTPPSACTWSRCADYPQGMPPDGRPGGTIRLLEDDDRDGRADRSTVFAEGLSLPDLGHALAGRRLRHRAAADPLSRGHRRRSPRGPARGGVRRLHARRDRQQRERAALGDRQSHPRRQRGKRRASAAETSLRGLDFRFDPRTRAFETTYQTAGGFGLDLRRVGPQLRALQHRPSAAALARRRATCARHAAMPPHRRDRERLGPRRDGAHLSDLAAGDPPQPSRAVRALQRGRRHRLARLRGRRPAARDPGLRRRRQPGVARSAARGRSGLRHRARARGARPRALRQPRPRVPADRRRDGPRRSALPDRHAARHDRAPRLHPRVEAARPRSARRQRSRSHLPHRAAARSPGARARRWRSSIPHRLVAELASPSRWRRDTAQRLLYERGSRSLAVARAAARDGDAPATIGTGAPARAAHARGAGRRPTRSCCSLPSPTRTRACARMRSRSWRSSCRAHASCASGSWRWRTIHRRGCGFRPRSPWASSTMPAEWVRSRGSSQRDAGYRWSRVAV